MVCVIFMQSSVQSVNSVIKPTCPGTDAKLKTTSSPISELTVSYTKTKKKN